MTDVVPVPVASPYLPADLFEPNLADDGPAPASLHQEINARRAQIENPELLRRLRGL